METIMNGYDLKIKFDHYNTLLFNDEIQSVELRWSALKSVGGCCEYRFLRGNNPRNKFDGAKLIPNSMRITISNLFERSEEEFDGILIHEMIHAYIATNNDFKETHGLKFKRILKECQKKVGFNIPLTDSFKELELADKSLREVGVMIFQEKRGYYRFAIMDHNALKLNVNTIKDYFSGHGIDIKCFTVSGKEWTTLSYKVVVNRKFSSRTAFYKLESDELAVCELLEQGKKVA